MDNFLPKIKDLISQNEVIGIAVGKNPTIDEMAAGLSLYLTLSESGKKVSIVSPTDPIVEVSSLVGVDKVKKSFGLTSGDLTVSFPYKEGEIEKISYTLENGFLNIMVKAGEQGLSFNEEDVLFKRGNGAPKLIFTVGVPRLSDLEGAFNIEDLKDTLIVNVDNHTDNQGFGDFVLVSKNSSSVSEQITSLLFSLGFTLTHDSAQNLMSGISFATANFQSSKTTPLAFEMAGRLLQLGATREVASAISAEDKSDLSKEDLYSFFNPQRAKKTVSVAPSPVPQPQPQPKADLAKEEKTDDIDNPPEDWLAPKIYKGSTSI